MATECFRNGATPLCCSFTSLTNWNRSFWSAFECAANDGKGHSWGRKAATDVNDCSSSSPTSSSLDYRVLRDKPCSLRLLLSRVVIKVGPPLRGNRQAYAGAWNLLQHPVVVDEPGPFGDAVE